MADRSGPRTSRGWGSPWWRSCFPPWRLPSPALGPGPEVVPVPPPAAGRSDGMSPSAACRRSRSPASCWRSWSASSHARRRRRCSSSSSRSRRCRFACEDSGGALWCPTVARGRGPGLTKADAMHDRGVGGGVVPVHQGPPQGLRWARKVRGRWWRHRWSSTVRDARALGAERAPSATAAACAAVRCCWRTPRISACANKLLPYVVYSRTRTKCSVWVIYSRTRINLWYGRFIRVRE